MPKVTFKNTNKSAEVDVGTELKVVTRAQNWPIAYGCEDGMCGTCLIKIAEGKENVSKMEEKEKMTLTAMGMDTSSYRLCCQCKVNGDFTVEQ